MFLKCSLNVHWVLLLHDYLPSVMVVIQDRKSGVLHEAIGCQSQLRSGHCCTCYLSCKAHPPLVWVVHAIGISYNMQFRSWVTTIYRNPSQSPPLVPIDCIDLFRLSQKNKAYVGSLIKTKSIFHKIKKKQFFQILCRTWLFQLSVTLDSLGTEIKVWFSTTDFY